ncbi:MAG: MMPL family transporter [Actinomycetota bacterium]
MRLNPETMARASARHPWRTITIWVVAVVAFGTASSALLGDVLTPDIEFTNDPESVRAGELIEANVTGEEQDTEFFVVLGNGTPVDDPTFTSYVSDVQTSIGALGDEVVGGDVVTVYDLQGAAQQAATPQEAQALEQRAASLVSTGGDGTLILVPIADNTAEVVDALKGVIEEHEQAGFELLLAGPATLNADTTEIAEEDLRKGEGIGLLFALLVLIVVFGALLAALLPISIAFVSIPMALGAVALIGQLFEFNIFTQNMATMIGLAVGIDYSLFIVARYREERRKGFDPMGAIGATGATASRAVFFSGLTVVFALLGMFLIPTTIFRSMAAGAILVVLASMLASLTLLPAMLSLLKDRINWPRLTRRSRQLGDPDPQGGFWDRFTRGVMRAPVLSLVVSVAILGGLGAIYFTIDEGTTQSAASLPDDVESKRAFQVLSQEFSAGGRTDPVQIYVEGDVQDPAIAESIAALQEEIAGIDAFAEGSEVVPADDGQAAVVQAIPAGDAFALETFEAVSDLRDRAVPAAFGDTGTLVLVGGTPAFFADFLSVADSYQPIVLAFVLGMSFLLLMVVFRSIVVPIKAVIMNLLSVGAAYGAIVLVFQHGFGIGAFNAIGFQFQQVEAIEAWIPLLLFSILFGLSMDYHVFLLSRIREEYDKTGDNDEAVAYGLRTTAGIITGAALIMVVVFTAFAAGRLVPLQQMGFGLAVAVFMDATIVRSVLVPASMKLLGDRNWYFPRWLEWIPTVSVEGHEPTLPPTVTGGGPDRAGNGQAERAVKTDDRV